MKVISAGILLYKIVDGKLKVFLAHPGGPFWKGKDENAWDFPKGMMNESEQLFDAALRELKEETGIVLSNRKREEFVDLGEIKKKNGWKIHIFAIEEKGEWTGLLMGDSYVEMEYPYKSGKKIKFLEVDKVGFFSIGDARKKVFVYLNEFLDRLEEKLKR